MVFCTHNRFFYKHFLVGFRTLCLASAINWSSNQIGILRNDNYFSFYTYKNIATVVLNVLIYTLIISMNGKMSAGILHVYKKVILHCITRITFSSFDYVNVQQIIINFRFIFNLHQPILPNAFTVY